MFLILIYNNNFDKWILIKESVIKSGLYSPKQLFITATVGGPAIAGFILACNLWAKEKKLLAIIPIILGLAFGVVIVFLLDSIVHFWRSNYPQLMLSPVLRHIVAFALYFLLLLVSAHTDQAFYQPE